jgi:hypothetical protein
MRINSLTLRVLLEAFDIQAELSRVSAEQFPRVPLVLVPLICPLVDVT